MPQLALKVDIDTHVGMRDGVPRLAAALARRGVRASFYVSCGPDHSGRAIRRVLKPGFLAKMLRTNAPGLYGWRTMLYGTLLPGPQIARAFPGHLRDLDAAGHELGVHGYDHVYWHDKLDRMTYAAVAEEVGRGLATFAEVCGRPAESFAAPGWQCTAHSLAALDAAGLCYHSCTRGSVPYRPCAGGRVFALPEIPTTWPTLDEVYGRVGTEPEPLAAFYAAQLTPGLNVHTIHAEAEGLALLPHFEALLDRLSGRVEFVRLIDVAGRLDGAALPVCEVRPGTTAGRAGTVATQGAPSPHAADAETR
ncbi:MAG: polysaccharide deacetylase family protein [Deltaproteobacteria bacterium]|nr:polysaccharide deacetylase family protein [Deltaproteobacteria bacterium]